MAVAEKTRLILAFRSGGICAFPGCGERLDRESSMDSDIHLAEAAHICGKSPDSARHDPNMTDEERNGVNNLIYLCRNHHAIIDKAEKDWPVSKLQEIKESHEKRMRKSTDDELPNVSFAELEKAIEWISSHSPVDDKTFKIIPPDEKIKKNNLSDESRNIILSGLTSCKTVAEYVTQEAKNDADFPMRLKAGFLEKYHSLYREGHKGDELFELMCAFSQRGLQSQSTKTAGLAVLIYLFEICDVFEK